MNLEVLAWAPRQKTFQDGMAETLVPTTGKPFASYMRDMAGQIVLPRRLVPGVGLNIDEIGEIVEKPAVYGPDGITVIVPALVLEGYHVNLRFHEPISEDLVAGLPQTDAQGNLLPLFQRTHLLTWFPGAKWDDSPGYRSNGPPGYVGVKQIKLYDPATIANRYRVWA